MKKELKFNLPENVTLLEAKQENGMLIAIVEEKKELRLELISLNLCGVFGQYVLFNISPQSGKLTISESVWEKWKNSGFPIEANASVEFCGDEYSIIGNSLENIDIVDGVIVNLDTTRPCPGCEDKNIKRLSNGVPIIYWED